MFGLELAVMTKRQERQLKVAEIRFASESQGRTILEMSISERHQNWAGLDRRSDSQN